MKAIVGETLPRTFVTWELLVPMVFGGTNLSFRVQNEFSLEFSESHQQL